jgi:RNA polymerase sigma factor (sigma-70 family)
VSRADTLYLEHRELIEGAIRFVSRRHRLPAADAQDFESTARLHLIAHDAAALRAFRGQSSLRTYLHTVVTRVFLDWRNARWGKWRPSAEARRLGPLAVQLETLTARDGLSFDEACETLRTNLGVTASRDELAAIAARFPRRSRRVLVSDEALETRLAPDGTADGPLARREAAEAAARAARELEQCLRSLPPQDRLILRMRFQDTFSVQQIARALSLDPKPLYRHITKVLGRLRRELEGAGITASMVANVLEQHGFDAIDAVDHQPGAETDGSVRLTDRNGRAPVQDSRRW